ncbi:MAG: DNA mismatch repair endonuclease MutL [Acetatifactor sp.]|nr:DNA mismatch repair endonuclease MutL [Acetatifactor sp.]
MAQIHILDSETIDKIAAGEVVERPSSVVKELVENAIDAGASAVTVEVKDGGIEFIRVTDNGCGMEREQLRTAFLRHATSKIENAEDLMRISSLGFRGEALSSIAAVSKVEVITKTAKDITGSRIILEGAQETAFEEVGAPEGTTFIVRNLFFNTPVRRKFLRQPATEGGYIADLMEHLALSRPDISFKLVLGNQMKFHTSGNGDLREVIYRIYGRDVANALVPIQYVQDGIKIEGYLGKPIQVRSNRNYEIYFINGRFVRSNVIARAVEEGYREYLMQHKFPLCVLHITMDTNRVDVNVHPTKMDVRFTDAMSFSALLCGAVKCTLKHHEMIPEALLSTERERKAEEKNEHLLRGRERTPEPFEQRRGDAYRVMEEMKYEAERPKMQEFIQNPVWARVKNGEIEEKMQEESANSAFSSQITVKKPQKMTDVSEKVQNSSESALEVSPESQVLSEQETFFTETSEIREKQPKQQREHGKSAEEPAGNPAQLNLFEEKLLTADNRRRFRIIGQVFETYWLIEFEDKLLMIDQHAAHEKVNYERLMKQFREKKVVSQTLMPPVIVSLSGQEEAVLKEHMKVFESLGFETESFGGSEYALRSVPVDLYGCGERQMFLEVLDQLAGGNFGGIQVVEEKIASMSCKAAVKGNNLLSIAEAEVLIDELLTLENPYNCPHGRPTVIAMTKSEMERKFKRIVT